MMRTFELWLEFELWRQARDTDGPNDFFKMRVKGDDGERVFSDPLVDDVLRFV